MTGRTSFNPTLVRLAPPPLPMIIILSSPFQSHLGSISTRRAACGRVRATVFQSHLGSISTVLLGGISGFPICFNPTLVRLARLSNW